MMSSSHTNEPAPSHVKFRGPDDVRNRSAWSTLNQSFKPPSPAQRKPTLDQKDMDEAKNDAVRALEALGIDDKPSKPSRSISKGKDRSRTIPVPILKGGILKNSNDNHDNKMSDEQPKQSTRRTKKAGFDINAMLFSRGSRESKEQKVQGLRATRSAWDITETRNSKTSVFGLSPARRQRTLDDSDLKEATTAVMNAMAAKNETTKKR